jgi:hypothetical protein
MVSAAHTFSASPDLQCLSVKPDGPALFVDATRWAGPDNLPVELPAAAVASTTRPGRDPRAGASER